MQTGKKAKYAYLILWIFWVMFCVRYAFTIGLAGPDGDAPVLTTALFVSVFCLCIPAVLLIFDFKKRLSDLIMTAGVVCVAGLFGLLFLKSLPDWISAVLLAMGSGILTAGFLYLFVYGLERRSQLIVMTVFLAAKPLSSFAALTFSAFLGATWNLITAGLILAGIFICGLFLRKIRYKDQIKTHISPASNQKMVWIYVLFALVVLERMNGVFKLYGGHEASSFNYNMYFIGCLIAALLSWWLFVYKRYSPVYAFIAFAAASILHFALSIAAVSGVLANTDLDMVFFGIADIVYIFLFVTAAKLSISQKGKGVFVGFVFVFGLTLLGGFGLSYLLFAQFREQNALIYSLISLVLVAASLLFAPIFFKIEQIALSASVKKSTNQEDTPISEVSDDDINGLLTTREKEVAQLLKRGYSNQQIAQTLFIATSTVKVYCRSIYEKLNIHSRAELLFLLMSPTKKS